MNNPILFTILLSLFGTSYSDDSGPLGTIYFNYAKTCDDSPAMSDFKLSLDYVKHDDGDYVDANVTIPYDLIPGMCEVDIVIDKYKENNWQYELYTIRICPFQLVNSVIPTMWRKAKGQFNPPFPDLEMVPADTYSAHLQGHSEDVDLEQVLYGELRITGNLSCRNVRVACIEISVTSYKN